MAALALAACQQQAPAPAAPEGTPGVSVTNARVILPAVRGNPAAIYFDLAYTGTGQAVLEAVDLAGAAKAEMHDSVSAGGAARMDTLPSAVIDRTAAVHFAPGGKHVMAFDLDPSLSAGGKSELTLVFKGGDKVNVAAALEAPGSAPAMAPMAGMSESPKP